LPDATILVLTTVPDRDVAVTLARTLLSGRLAACVSIGGPQQSMYHWQGAIETADERMLTVKTTGALYSRVEAAIRAAHPYELPEIIAVPVIHGSPAFLAWIAAETRSG
jgi:periplasmic divalent cation tolerance protein